MPIDLGTAAEIATIVGVLLVVGWFIAVNRKNIIARVKKGATAAAGDIQAETGSIVVGHNSSVTFNVAADLSKDGLQEITVLLQSCLKELSALNNNKAPREDADITRAEFFKFLNSCLEAKGTRWKFKSLPPSGLEVPPTGLRFVANTSQSLWAINRTATPPGIQITTRWHVTNVSADPVRLLSARLVSPEIDDAYAFVVTSVGKDNRHSMSAEIPPGETWNALISYHGRLSEGQSFDNPLVAKFVVVDQFAHEHQLPPITVTDPMMRKS